MSSVEEELRTFGIVKWFNNKNGYGFITVLSGEYEGRDIFIHHTGIKTVKSHYKYLVQGEYVSFDVLKCEDQKHELQGSCVTGPLGKSLMCEIKFVSRDSRDRGSVEHSVEESA